ncbi:MAG TPA: hypothetical protein VLA88_05275 [Candidatus Saccharimonadales bacterium]|nr:hypothetical protein [Candidatus Saccharimonadales bacterium]
MTESKKQRTARLTTLKRSLVVRTGQALRKLHELDTEVKRLRQVQNNANLDSLANQIANSLDVLTGAREQLAVLRDKLKKGELDEVEALGNTIGIAVEAEKANLFNYSLALIDPRRHNHLLARAFSRDPGDGNFDSLSLERALLALCGLITIRRNQGTLAIEAAKLEEDLDGLRAIYNSPPYDAAALLGRAGLLGNTIRDLKRQSDDLHYQ